MKQYDWVMEKIKEEFPELEYKTGEFDWGYGFAFAVKEPISGKRTAFKVAYVVSLDPVRTWSINDEPEEIENIVKMIHEWKRDIMGGVSHK